MTMLERYGVDYPCIVDDEILTALNLPNELEEHIQEWDYFLHYDNDNRIVWAYLGDERYIYNTIDELKAELLEHWEILKSEFSECC